jgi:Holliday junction resolvase
MTSASKAKGNSFERVVADFLTATYGEKFIRVPGSGAYIGGANTFRKDTLHEAQVRSFKGDIVPGESFPRLNAECKSYKDFPFHQLFSGHVKQLEAWIDQCMDVADAGDFNILFMKFNRKGTFVAVQLQDDHKFNLVRYINYGSIKHDHWAIMDFDTFFELNQDAVKELCK